MARTGKVRILEAPTPRLHLLNGGFGNEDRRTLERAARGNGRVKSWIVPKSALIGDEAVINVAGHGLFATGRIASSTAPRRDWKNRYGAGLDSIKLIGPSISLEEVRREIPDLGWARYPRSIATPAPELALSVHNLVRQRLKKWEPKLTLAALELASPEELRRIALLSSAQSVAPRERKTIYRIRSEAIRRYVLWRASGRCEACGKPGPFRTTSGKLFLEAHHTMRLADGGPDHPSKVIGLCPNCHRRAHHGVDAKSFNAALVGRLAKLERRLLKR